MLDDGWFGKRDSDKAGLGDYDVNRRKLPRGMAHFARKIRRLGMEFGLWFEPEMVNPDSSLYRSHPEYAVVTPGRKPTMGRNQLVLDLCNPDVRDYIVNSVSRILDEAGITYVKWDMNRHISDACSSLENQGNSSTGTCLVSMMSWKGSSGLVPIYWSKAAPAAGTGSTRGCCAIRSRFGSLTIRTLSKG